MHRFSMTVNFLRRNILWRQQIASYIKNINVNKKVNLDINLVVFVIKPCDVQRDFQKIWSHTNWVYILLNFLTFLFITFCMITILQASSDRRVRLSLWRYEKGHTELNAFPILEVLIRKLIYKSIHTELSIIAALKVDKRKRFCKCKYMNLFIRRSN